MINLLFVLGPTGTGKSTFLKTVSAAMPDKIGLVEVGKKLRVMYPPDYFQGQGAPQHTQKLAMQLCNDGIKEHMDAGKQCVLIDGQPRNPAQMDEILSTYLKVQTGFELHGKQILSRFLHLFTPVEVRRARLEACYKDDLGSLELARSRLLGDLAPLYEVLSMLHDVCHHNLITINTVHPQFEPVQLLKTFMLLRAAPPLWTIPTNAPNSSISGNEVGTST